MSQPLIEGVCIPNPTKPAPPRPDSLSPRIISRKSSHTDRLQQQQDQNHHQSQHQQHHHHHQKGSHHNHHSQHSIAHSLHSAHPSRLQGPMNTSNGLLTSISLASTSPSAASSSSTPSSSSSPTASSPSTGISSPSRSSPDASSFRKPARLTSTNATSSLSAARLATPHVGSHSSIAIDADCESGSGKETTGAVGDRSGGSKKEEEGEELSLRSKELQETGVVVTSQPPPSTLPSSNLHIAAVDPQLGDGTQSLQTEQPQVTAMPLSNACNGVPTIAQRDAIISRVYTLCRSENYFHWLHLLEMAQLASQHHLSGYNCMKFGKQGSPYAYFPLTLQQPRQADAVTDKQRVSEREALTWLQQKRKRKGTAQQEKERGLKRGGGALEGDASEPRDSENFRSMSGVQVKLARPNGEDESGDSVDCEMRESSPSPAGTKDGSDRKKEEVGNGDDEVKMAGPLAANESMRQEWEDSLVPGQNCESGKSSSDESDSCATPADGKESPSAAPKEMQDKPQQEQVQQQHQSSIKTSDSHPISISPMIPAELMIEVTRYVLLGASAIGYSLDRSVDRMDEEVDAWRHGDRQTQGECVIRCPTTRVDLWEIAQKAECEMIEAAQAKRAMRMLALQPSQQSDGLLETVYLDKSMPEDGNCDAVPVAFGGRYTGFTIGNMLLSSCPGKKVRLTGPVRGRGTICRNLGLDLKRIKSLGVGTIVCCLDDEELAFLGAPWSEYEREADQLGMEVIRLPMAEGFCPTDINLTDTVITSLVQHSTLRGINVLVHCRGGVGRAGLIACAWMLKLGLVRSDADEDYFQRIVSSAGGGHDGDSSANGLPAFPPPPSSSDGSSSRRETSTAEEKQQETMQIIHRLIETIRRRRSPKAIETAEQVAFLHKYVNFLHEQEAQRRISQCKP